MTMSHETRSGSEDDSLFLDAQIRLSLTAQDLQAEIAELADVWGWPDLLEAIAHAMIAQQRKDLCFAAALTRAAAETTRVDFAAARISGISDYLRQQ